MRYIKIFKDFNDIHSICNKYGIKNYTINDDGSIDVDGDVDLMAKTSRTDNGLIKLPLRFRNVSGDFNCGDNQLTTLEGSPQSVVGSFYCRGNQLTSLEGAPQSVGVDFYCNYNILTSLRGAPQSLAGDFYCSNNQLTSLEGSPKSIGGDFYCVNNKLINLEGFPKSIGGDFFCSENPIYSIWNLFKNHSLIEMFNDYDPIRDNKVIILDRLNSFLQEIGQPTVTEDMLMFNSVDGWKCI